jgi:hypothetical protein
MAYWSTGSIYENPYCLHRLRRLSASEPLTSESGE